ncbi:hypothetical protein ACFQ36_03450 [Arthrobacter sp. GCM10027362]|uniref:hypothetical protein n=1 Tax=Arthrobacter sp. GCM10027362 TaxID=3273379 RepID=UPI00363F5B76
MPIDTPKLKITDELKIAARQAGVEIARSHHASPVAPVGSPTRKQLLHTECARWAQSHKDQIPVPQASPGCLVLIVGCVLLGVAGQLGGSGAWVGVIGFAIGLVGANMTYNQIVGVKSPNYVAEQVRITVAEVAGIALDSALSHDRQWQAARQISRSASPLIGASESTPDSRTPISPSKHEVPDSRDARSRLDGWLEAAGIDPTNAEATTLDSSMPRPAPLNGAKHYLVYINDQARRMDLNRYFKLAALCTLSARQGVIFSSSGFTDNVKDQADRDSMMLFGVTGFDPSLEPLSMAATEVMK